MAPHFVLLVGASLLAHSRGYELKNRRQNKLLAGMKIKSYLITCIIALMLIYHKYIITMGKYYRRLLALEWCIVVTVLSTLPFYLTGLY